MTITMTDDMEVLHNLKNSPEFRCRTLPQYFILMEINDIYGTGAFELELIDRYHILATDSEGRKYKFRWDIHTKLVTMEAID